MPRVKSFASSLILPAILGFVLLAAAPAALASNPIEGEFICPLCKNSHVDFFLRFSLGPWPFYVGGGEPGTGSELSFASYEEIGGYDVMSCPHCGYSNAITGFNFLYLDDVEVRQNPYVPSSRKAAAEKAPLAGDPAGPEKADAAAAGLVPLDEKWSKDKEYHTYLRLFPAPPLDYPTIKANLARSVTPATFQYVNACFPERFNVMLRTLPGLSTRERYGLALEGAWSCDEAGEMQLGLEFRARAVEEGRRLLNDLPPDTGLKVQLILRHQVAELEMKVGWARKDLTLRAEGRKTMEAVIAQLEPILQKAEKEDAEVETRRDRIRRRALEINKDASVPPDAEDFWSEDSAIVALEAEIRHLPPREKPFLSSGTSGLAEWVGQARKLLAANELRDKTLEEAMATVRKGTPIQQEAFLMLYGGRYQESPVKEFARELLLPLSLDTFDVQGGGMFSRTTPDASPQFQRYVLAIAQGCNHRRLDSIQCRIIQTLLPEKMGCLMPKLPETQPAEKGAAEEETEAGDYPNELTNLIPANANRIRQWLQTLEDLVIDDRAISVDTFANDQGYNETVRDLCCVDAPWMAEVIIEDAARRPRLYIHNHCDYDTGPRLFVPVYDGWTKTPPDELIARHLPDRAKLAAQEAMAQLAYGKATPPQAAVTLLPLAHLQDDESLQILRHAAKSPVGLVCQRARGALKTRRDVWVLRLQLEEAAQDPAKAIDWWPGSSVLMEPSDAPLLRKVLRVLLQADGRATIAGGREAFLGHAARAEQWVLAALDHLGDAEALRQYNALAFKVETQPGDLWDKPSYIEGASLYYTPTTARYKDLETMLRLARWCYCSEAMADELMKNSNLLPHWFLGTDQEFLAALAANPKTHDRYRRLAANLAPRPVELRIKEELLLHAAEIRVPEVDEAVRRWSASDHAELAALAREALGRLKP
jgi:hypothetical protein